MLNDFLQMVCEVFLENFLIFFVNLKFQNRRHIGDNFTAKKNGKIKKMKNETLKRVSTFIGNDKNGFISLKV